MAIQDVDVSSDPYGITYSFSGQIWEVLKGVDVTGADTAVYSAFTDSRLINRGSLVGLDDWGVMFEAGGANSTYVVKNKASGHIVGKEIGVYAYSFTGSFTVKNQGIIEATSNIGVVSQGSGDTRIDNRGRIAGPDAAINIAPDNLGAKGAKITNFGELQSAGVAIALGFYPGVAFEVWNRKGGKIEGVLAAIDSNGPLTLRNDGKIIGAIFGDSERDVIVNTKKIKGNIALSDGDDVLKNKGKGKVVGLIDTGIGNDKVVLGAKKEMLLFDSALSATLNVDRLKHFKSGKDGLYLDDDTFAALTPGVLSPSEFRAGPSAQDGDDFVIYDKASGALYYDPDGLGGADQTQFAQFDRGTKLKFSDIMAGEFSL
ncbi:MAG: hypothetical protein KDK07_14600 [Bauldia sp.]|nr:hypothetical protein [Bauldia sp.]